MELWKEAIELMRKSSTKKTEINYSDLEDINTKLKLWVERYNTKDYTLV